MSLVIIPHRESSSFLYYFVLEKKSLFVPSPFFSLQAMGVLYCLEVFKNPSFWSPRLDTAYIKALQLRSPNPISRNCKMDGLFGTD